MQNVINSLTNGTQGLLMSLFIIIPFIVIVFIIANVIHGVKVNKLSIRVKNLSYGIEELKTLYSYRPTAGHYLGRFYTETVGGVTINSYDGWLVYYNTYPATFGFIITNDAGVAIQNSSLTKALKIAALKLNLIDIPQLAKYDNDHNESSIFGMDNYVLYPKGISVELNTFDKGSQG